MLLGTMIVSHSARRATALVDRGVPFFDKKWVKRHMGMAFQFYIKSLLIIRMRRIENISNHDRFLKTLDYDFLRYT